MSENLIGAAQLEARLRAVAGVSGGAMLHRMQLQVLREAKIAAPVKTGNLRRTVIAGPVTRTYADVVAGANYAAYVEFGTGPHEITPKAKLALAWAATAAGRRLTGSPRKAARAGGLGGMVFATHVNHPGTKANPFMERALQAVAGKAGALAEVIVQAWNTERAA